MKNLLIILFYAKTNIKINKVADMYPLINRLGNSGNKNYYIHSKSVLNGHVLNKLRYNRMAINNKTAPIEFNNFLFSCNIGY